MKTPQEVAQQGMSFLEEAILQVLYVAWRKHDRIGASEISRRTEIFSDAGDSAEGEPGAFGNAIVSGMLVKLHRCRKIQKRQEGNKRPWYELTDEELLRRDDSGKP